MNGPRSLAVVRACWLACWVLAGSACEGRQQPSNSFYSERIAPILDVGCQQQTTGCHVDNGRGFALGNLDLQSYNSLMLRRDVLPAYGPYPIGLLLLKAGNAAQIDVRTIDPPDPSQPDKRSVRITTDIRHAAGEGAIAQGSTGYSTLKHWIDSGYKESGVPYTDVRHNSGDCSTTVIERPYIDTRSAVQDADSYHQFVRDVAPILRDRCAGSNCHGAQLADLYLTCGDSDEQLRWNYELALRYLDSVAVSSELLRRPLATLAGGVYHEGGDVFPDVDDNDYRVLLAWADSTVQRSPQLLDFGQADEGLRFFADRVQPVLVRKGCMFLNCHSPAMFHDLRLRGGSQGFFSEVATRRNYEMTRDFLAIDSPDPNQSRVIAKNLCPVSAGGEGVQHRGGPLLEDFGGCAQADTRASVERCQGVDADHGDLNQIPAYCVLARWHAIERQAAIARGELPSDAGPRAIVFITRPEGVGGIADFDTYRPGADLIWADVGRDQGGALELTATRSLLAACGLDSASADLRGTAVSWDAKTIAFAARSAVDAPLRIYELHTEDDACAPNAAIAAHDAQQHGILLHDFDPAYAPDGRIVFASTRGNIEGGSDVRGPTRTPASLAPNANLYVYSGGQEPAIRQLTFLSNQELSPSFMADGRVIFTTEKRALDFHQFAARRQNLDGGDYHPLIAQRPSIGFASATEVVELPNKDFALVMANLDAVDGGGSIAILNRTIGPDQSDRDPADRGYIHSVHAPVAGAFGGDSGVYRSPWPLPSGHLLASCDLTGTDPARGPHHYALCDLDPNSSATPRVLWRDDAKVAVEPVALWARQPRAVFKSRADEANGSTRVEPDKDDAVIHFTDLPMLSTLLFANTRTGRPIPKAFQQLEVFESRPPPVDARSFDELDQHVVTDRYGPFYQDLRSLGRTGFAPDGSLRVRIAGGVPITLQLLDADGEPLRFGKDGPFAGVMRQREEMQFYPGERIKQSIPRKLFNGVCGGCHGSISGHELDVVVNVDVLSGASVTLADDDPLDLR